MDYAINDKEMKQCMIDDLEENYNYTIKEIEEWISQHGDALISEMWDAYSSYIEINAIFKDQKNDN